MENRGLQVLLRGSFSPGMRELGLLAMDLFGTLSGQGDPLVASLIAFSFHYWSRNLWVGSLMLRNQMMTTTVPSKLSQFPPLYCGCIQHRHSPILERQVEGEPQDFCEEKKSFLKPRTLLLSSLALLWSVASSLAIVILFLPSGSLRTEIKRKKLFLGVPFL